MTAAGTLVLALALTPTPPAGAVNNNPSGNPTSPAVSYENDCIGTTSTGAIQDAPLVTSTVIDTTTGSNDVLPQGATFGVAGTVSQTLAGAVIAGANQLGDSVFGTPPSSFNISATETFGPTDANSTGSYTYTTPSFAAQANPGGVVTGVTFSSGSTTLTGDFSGVPADAAVFAPGIPLTAVTTAAGTSTSITISEATTSASTGTTSSGASYTSVTVGWAPFAGLTFTDSSFATPSTAFTTAAPKTLTTGAAGIGVTGMNAWTFYLTVNGLTLPGAHFGGGGNGAGASGTNTCIETGYVNSTTPGPALYSQTGPMLPPGLTTPLLATTTTGSGATLDSVPTDFQPGAYANLQAPPPSTTTSVTTSPTSATYGSSVTYTATVTSTGGTPTGGTVAFTTGGATLCTATLSSSGTASCTATTAPVGTDTVTGTYSGDADFGASSATAPLAVSQASTNTKVSTNPSAVTLGTTVTYSATVTSTGGTPTGTVAFTTGGATLCTATLSSSGTASCTATNAPIGTDTVTGTYSGDADFHGSLGRDGVAGS
ncbi:MAG: Ig-like domain-containing protein, partial [Actinomycetota bacterium]|nr:Ig-like domain-containing protein [Actinomycetota bacterium]